MNHALRVFPDTFSLVRELAFIIKQKINNNRLCNIAISGGSTPSALFKHLAAYHASDIQWANAHFYWVDERCVDPEHPESNYGKAKIELFSKIDIPSSNIHPVDGTNNPQDEAERYSNIIEINLGKQPSFDLVLLGMGEDGHTASLFPNQLALMESKNICESALHPLLPQYRVSLTANTINEARHVIFMVTGQSKAEIVKNVVKYKDNKYPASYIGVNGNTEWYLDEAAASQIH